MTNWPQDYSGAWTLAAKVERRGVGLHSGGESTVCLRPCDKPGFHLRVGAEAEQFIGVNEDSPTFNRLRGTYTQFFPVNWLKLHKGCRPDAGEVADCPQAIGLQVKAGTIIGDLPLSLIHI